MTGPDTGPVRIADYEIVHTLGRRGDEVRLLARSPERLGLGGGLVALRLLPPVPDPGRFRALTDALRLLAGVGSPHLVALYDAGREGDRPWYSLEHCPDGSLATPAGTPDRPRLLSALAQACRGAHALHECGLVHRGIRPGTVLLSGGRAVLAEPDLGALTDPGRATPAATPAELEYVDPALLRGEPAGRSADVWSLGLTVHRVLSGHDPRPGTPPDDLPAAVHRVLATGPVVSPDLAAADAALVSACLAPDPADRPGTALELAERIEALP